MIEREAIAALIDARGCLTVRVTPNARSERMALEPEAAEGPKLKVWLTVPPENGKANKAVLALLARALGLPKSALVLARGDTSRTKVVHVTR